MRFSSRNLLSQYCSLTHHNDILKIAHILYSYQSELLFANIKRDFHLEKINLLSRNTMKMLTSTYS